MEIIEITRENICREHICCALSDGFDACADAKKAWMRSAFPDGLTFRRLDARGKVMIEYVPAERAWAPIEADGYMHIDCFWVSGQYKGQGWGARLLDECIEDSKARGRAGLTAISSAKKRPFLSDGDYLRRRGFRLADTAEPYFELLYLPFASDAPIPRFSACAKRGAADLPGLALYFSDQCPHAGKYARLIREVAARHGLEMTLIKLESAEDARRAPTPFPTYSLFADGRFVTHEILSEKKFEKLLAERGARGEALGGGGRGSDPAPRQGD